MPTDEGSKDISRRSFMKRTAISGVGLALAPDILSADLLAVTPKSTNSTMIGVPFEARERVRLGIIGVGGRGTSLLQDLLAIENVEVKAICDLVPEKVARAQKAVTDAGQAEPKGFSKGEQDFKNLTELELDIVYVATPWNWHVPMAISAMKNGKHAAVEVPACTTLQECWDLVDTSEATRKHCVILENCCYGATEMMVLGMVRDGLFGEITHGEAAYLHDLREHFDRRRRGRPVAARSAHQAQRQFIPDARTGPSRPLYGYPSRRPVRLYGFGEFVRGFAERLCEGELCRRRSEARRKISLRRYEHQHHKNPNGPHHSSPT